MSTIDLKPSPVRTASNSGFIIGPIADSILIIGAPLVSLIVGAILFSIPNEYFDVQIRFQKIDFRQFFLQSFINAHLFLVYFRSHANPTIFRGHPWRFTLVPVLVFVIGGLSPAILGMMGLVAVWWDVYHSSLQTFGFGRIYDSKRKNNAIIGRDLDFWMNLLVYTGPVLAGAHFLNHLTASVSSLGFLTFDSHALNDLLVNQTPAFLMQNQIYLTLTILILGGGFVVYYLASYYRFSRQGYHVSWQKVWLMLITAGVSIYCWGFHSFIDAFWVMNVFHALQYFAIVAFIEQQNLAKLFHVASYRFSGLLVVIWLTSFGFLYGVWSGYFADGEWWKSVTLTTALMHFWYDGFIWSVSKKQV